MIKHFRIYKPKKTNDGAASSIDFRVIDKKVTKDSKEYKVRDVLIFWVITQQTGTDSNDNATFGWNDDNKKVIFKLGEVDIGEILAVLNGVKTQVGSDKGLFHQNNKGNASFQFTYSDKYKSYTIRIAKKVDGKLVSAQHLITVGEAQVLKILLETAVKKIYNWE